MIKTIVINLVLYTIAVMILAASTDTDVQPFAWTVGAIANVATSAILWKITKNKSKTS